ncbi:MAG: DNA repair protein RecN [Ruminococcaceae bacterium]|nr:DNA repair protein RecN [Oscillospiraceae bacterium]
MIYSLHIENIAVIKCVDIDFGAGFTALTGETGAGKSILIDSINFLLGARTSKDIIRSGEDKATVSAMFGGFSKADTKALADNDVFPDEDGNLLISRIMSADGRTQSKINSKAVNTSAVRAIAPMLVNIHGQNDSLRLLEDENHIVFLDAYAENTVVYSEYLQRYEEMRKAQKTLAELRLKNDEKSKKEAELKSIVKLLESAKIKIGEEDALIAEKKIVANAEKISKQTSFVYRALKGSEKANASYILDRCASALLQIADSVPSAATLVAKLNDMKYEVEDIADTVYDFAAEIGDDPTAKLDKIESRLNTIAKLKKHFLADEAGLVELLAKTKKELSELLDMDSVLERAMGECAGAEDNARDAAARLTESRVVAAKKLIPLVSAELEFLDMEKVVFDISVTESGTLSPSGADKVVFLISANRGEEPRPISKIASGGELARIMLAVKTVFADAFGVHTVIYDEVDTGVSGKTARKIGIKLKESAKATQTICVTHSAQIASLANAHMLIKKNAVGERTETTVTEIDGNDRVYEIARILGGVTVSENMLVSAKELIDEGKNI